MTTKQRFKLLTFLFTIMGCGEQGRLIPALQDNEPENTSSNERGAKNGGELEASPSIDGVDNFPSGDDAVESSEFLEPTELAYVELSVGGADSQQYYLALKIKNPISSEDAVMAFERSFGEEFILVELSIADKVVGFPTTEARSFIECWISQTELYVDNEHWGVGLLTLPEGVARAPMDGILRCND